MNSLKAALKRDFGVTLADEFSPILHGNGYTEYLQSDVITVAEEIDDHLTILWDADLKRIVGARIHYPIT